MTTFSTMGQALKEEVDQQPLKCVQELRQSFCVRLAENGHANDNSAPISGNLIRDAVRVLMLSPCYWLQTVSNRLETVKYFSKYF